MKNKTLNPTTLFGKNGEGTPWEEATGAENSKRDIEKIEKRFSYIWMLNALAIIFFVLAALSFLVYHCFLTCIGMLVQHCFLLFYLHFLHILQKT